MKNTAGIFIFSLVVAFASCTKYRDVPGKQDNFVAPTTSDIAFGSLRINEYMCKGTAQVSMDYFGGSTSKWFEVYNTTAFPITLTAGQWFFTDDLTTRTKFSVPTNTAGPQWVIAPKGFLAVICVKSDGSTTPAAGKVNANFSLSSTTGAIGVFYQKDPSSAIIPVDTFAYTFSGAGAATGISYGRKPDGVGSLLNPLSKVTPEASNN